MSLNAKYVPPPPYDEEKKGDLSGHSGQLPPPYACSYLRPVNDAYPCNGYVCRRMMVDSNKKPNLISNKSHCRTCRSVYEGFSKLSYCVFCKKIVTKCEDGVCDNPCSTCCSMMFE